jgi:hypothetical protein
MCTRPLASTFTTRQVSCAARGEAVSPAIPAARSGIRQALGRATCPDLKIIHTLLTLEPAAHRQIHGSRTTAILARAAAQTLDPMRSLACGRERLRAHHAAELLLRNGILSQCAVNVNNIIRAVN